MPDINDSPVNYDLAFSWAIEIDGIERARFNKCSELSVEIGEVLYREGGRLRAAAKQPGLVTYPDITLEHGASANREFAVWLKQVYDSATDGGEVADGFKRDLDIVVLDRDGQTEKRRVPVRRAWVKKLVMGEWDATSESVLMEKVTLAFDEFDPAPNA